MSSTPVVSASTMARATSARALMAMLVLAVMWGLSIPVTKLGLITMPPLTLTAVRFAIAVPVLLLLLVGKPRLPLRAFPAVAALGIIGIGIGQVAQTIGVTGTSASAGTIISATIPVFVVLFAAVQLKQPISMHQMAGIAMAFLGIAVVAFGNGEDQPGAATTTVQGALWLLVSALAVAFYYVWSVELTRAHGTATVAAWSTLFGFVALLPWAIWEAAHTPFVVTFEALAAGAYLGLIVSVAGLFLWLHILREVSAGTAASVQFLQPAFGIAASAWIFGDRIGLNFGLGVVLILCGLALSLKARRTRPA
jgi:O-acetylserine/cysteine efflux transporter